MGHHCPKASCRCLPHPTSSRSNSTRFIRSNLCVLRSGWRWEGLSNCYLFESGHSVENQFENNDTVSESGWNLQFHFDHSKKKLYSQIQGNYYVDSIHHLTARVLVYIHIYRLNLSMHSSAKYVHMCLT